MNRLRGPRPGGAIGTSAGPGEPGPADQAALLAGTGLVDVEWYSRRTGAEFSSPHAAAAHFLAGGWRAASIHPLVDLASLPAHVREGFESGRSRPFVVFLGRRGLHRPLGPLFDPRLVPGSDEDKAAHPGGALGLYLDGATDDAPLPGHPALTLGRAVERLEAALSGAEHPAAPTARTPRATVVVVTSGEAATTSAALTAALDHAGGDDVDAVLVERGAGPVDTAHLAAAWLDDDRVRRVSVPQATSDATARRTGAALSGAPVLVLLDAGARPRPGWLVPLLARLDDPAVCAAAPVVLREDDTVLGLGPEHELDGHPREDALAWADRTWPTLPLLALALRASDLDALEAGTLVGTRVVAPEAQVTLAPGHAPAPVQRTPAPATARVSVTEGPPRLRWGLKLPAPPGDRGDAWGDAHFADSLAAALRRIGQEVVTHRRRAHDTPATRLDDVSLVLRGLDVVAPQPGATNLIWVISHPDDVDPAELHDFDVVLAASAPWAERMSERCGRPVHALLQCTDLGRRADPHSPVGDGSRPVFVGATNPRRPRPIVGDAVAAGVPLVVHGPHWEGLLPPEHLGSSYVPNDQLSAVYRRHGLVLADHWSDMAAEGFIANRLFDAVAAGARVVCDPIDGLEVFRGAVQAYHSPEELGVLCSPEGRSRFPSPAEMEEISNDVAAAHSFDRRAQELLDLVLARRA